MAAVKTLIEILEVDGKKFSKEERIVIENILFWFLCNELNDHFKNKYKIYLSLIKCGEENESIVLEMNFFRAIVNDLLASEVYTIGGIAYYTNTNEDAIYEILLGRNPNPSFEITRRLMDLHLSIREGLYKQILKKIIHNSFA